MKLSLALFLSFCMAGAAAAQEKAAPAQPAAGAPAMPSKAEPALPSQDKPAMPSGEKPAMPDEDEPAMPSEDKPAQSGKISEWIDTTPDQIRSPEGTFFRPFHVEGSTLALIQVFVDKEMTIDVKTGEKRLYTPRELKKKQALELKALRKSLLRSPNSEIRKAVKAKQAEQAAEMKTLQKRIRAEAEKDQKVSPKPKPVTTEPEKPAISEPAKPGISTHAKQD